MRLVAVGDVGHVTPAQRAIAAAITRRCAADPCDAVLVLGDLLYPSGPTGPDDPRLDEVLGVYTRLGAPVWLVAGNHDHGQRGRDAPVDAEIAWAAARGPVFPAPDWRASLGDVDLWGLDTDRVFWGRAPGAWLDAELDASTARWRIGFGHHPMRSQGPHGNAGAYEGRAWLPWFSGRALETFFRGRICGKVDLWLAGHDHLRELLPATPTCPTTLVVSGSGARGTRVVDRGNDATFASADEGFVEIELADVATVRFVRADGDVDGTFTVPARPTR